MEEEKNRLILIDGNAILHRAFHALPPLTTRNGELVNAVYGFASMLLKILEDFKPEYLIVAFDTPKPTFRQQEFVGYQANRPKTDAELAGQIEKVHEMVRTFNIPVYEVEGFEADDVIGSLAVQASQFKVQSSKFKVDEVLIVTGDRDLMQLVNEQVKLFMPQRGLSEGKMFGEKEVEEKMGIPPNLLVDYKSLVGDASDGYPGVPGIGPKTAIELLKKFGSLEEIYGGLGINLNRKLVTLRHGGSGDTENSAFPKIQCFSVAKGVSELIMTKLRNGYESAMLSKKLATIVTDAPVNLDLEKAKAVDFDKEKVIEFFKELGFRSLVGRVRGDKVDEGKRGEQRGTKETKINENQISLF